MPPCAPKADREVSIRAQDLQEARLGRNHGFNFLFFGVCVVKGCEDLQRA
jgi:hypothetical protein